jgi:hypothetical protein
MEVCTFHAGWMKNLLLTGVITRYAGLNSIERLVSKSNLSWREMLRRISEEKGKDHYESSWFAR